jgi:hypothetical protein
MIGKPEWFTYRTFGWGITPKKWQGWVYVGALAFIIGLIMSVHIVDSIRAWLFFGFMGILLLDVLHIMIQLPKHHDERENLQQLIIERNCSFAAIVALIAMAIFEVYKNQAAIVQGALPFDVSIMVVLGAMVVTKAASALYLKAKM